MNTATMDYQPSGLRVSDADRDRAIAELGEHFQAGRLTADELEDRTGRALTARTAGDLAELFADLPRRPSAGLARQPASQPPAGRGGVPAVPLVVLAVLVLGGFVSGHHAVIGLVPLLLVFLIVRRHLGGGRRRDYPGDRR